MYEEQYVLETLSLGHLDSGFVELRRNESIEVLSFLRGGGEKEEVVEGNRLTDVLSVAIC